MRHQVLAGSVWFDPNLYLRPFIFGVGRLSPGIEPTFCAAHRSHRKTGIGYE